MLAIIALAHAPSLASGYISDDAALSLIAGDAKLAGVSNHRVVIDFIGHFAQIGRFFPIAALTLYHFVIAPSLTTYKASKLVAVLGSLAIWGCFVRRLTGSRRIALLAVLIVGTLTEYRLYHDAILSFGWMLPLALSLAMGSLLLQLAHQSRGGRWRLAASVALFAAAALTYEVCVALVPIHAYLAIRSRGGQSRAAASRLVLPHVMVAVALLLVVAWLRSLPGFTPNPDYRPTLSGAAAVAVLEQTLGAIPLSYRLFDPNGLFRASSLFRPVSVGQVVVAATSGIVVWRTIRHETSRRVALAPLFWVGAALLVLPGTPLALAPKYQRELRLGLAYLPAHIAICGSALLLIALTLLVSRRTGPRGATRVAAAAAFVVALAAYVAQADNRRVVANLDVEWLHPRSLLELAARRGFFAELRDGDNVVVESGLAAAPWETRAFFVHESGVRLRGVGRWPRQLSGFGGGNAPDARVTRRFDDRSGEWLLSYYASGSDEGYALLARLAFFDGTQRVTRAAHGHRVKIMLRTPTPGDSRRSMGYFFRQNAFLSVDYLARGPDEDGPWTLRRESAASSAHSAHLECVEQDEGWQIWVLDEGASVIDLESITIAASRYGDVPGPWPMPTAR